MKQGKEYSSATTSGGATDDSLIDDDEESMDWWTKYFASVDAMIEVSRMYLDNAPNYLVGCVIQKRQGFIEGCRQMYNLEIFFNIYLVLVIHLIFIKMTLLFFRKEMCILRHNK